MYLFIYMSCFLTHPVGIKTSSLPATVRIKNTNWNGQNIQVYLHINILYIYKILQSSFQFSRWPVVLCTLSTLNKCEKTVTQWLVSPSRLKTKDPPIGDVSLSAESDYCAPLFQEGRGKRKWAGKVRMAASCVHYFYFSLSLQQGSLFLFAWITVCILFFFNKCLTMRYLSLLFIQKHMFFMNIPAGICASVWTCSLVPTYRLNPGVHQLLSVLARQLAEA